MVFEKELPSVGQACGSLLRACQNSGGQPWGNFPSSFAVLASQAALLLAVEHSQVGDESITVLPSLPWPCSSRGHPGRPVRPSLLLGTGLIKGFGPRRVLLMGVGEAHQSPRMLYLLKQRVCTGGRRGRGSCRARAQRAFRYGFLPWTLRNLSPALLNRVRLSKCSFLQGEQPRQQVF